MTMTLLLLALVGCTGSAELPKAPVVAPIPEAPPEFEEDDSFQGMRVNLRTASNKTQGAADSVRAPSAPAAPPTPLDAAAAKALLAKAEPLQDEPDDKQVTRLPGSSPPPPRPGGDLIASFPPRADAAPAVQSGPVQVVRFAPEGEVPLAPRVSITFDQPMVALTTQDEAAKTVPAELSPQPEGAWRWLGTRTLVFDPEERLPMATEYTVTVPAGTASVSGQPLEKAHAFSFATPAPKVLGMSPELNEWVDVRPVLSIRFDQAVATDTVLNRVVLKGSSAPSLRLATDIEIADGVTSWTTDPYTVHLTVSEPLQKDTGYQLVVPAGLVGDEGPRPSTKTFRSAFRTYAPLKVVGSRCGYSDDCPPTQPLMMEVNNPLDSDQDLSSVTVTPEVPGLTVTASYTTVVVQGRFDPRTRYKVTLPAALVDQFDQPLGSDVTRTFDVGPAVPRFDPAGGSFVVLDPNGAGTWPVFSTNHRSMKARIHRVKASDWRAWRTYRDRYRYDDASVGRPPGEQVFRDRIAIDGESDRQTETPIDLQPWLDEGHGMFVAILEATEQPRDQWQRQRDLVFIQATRLGLHSFVDRTHITTWVTDLATGAPIADVEVTLAPAGVSGRTDAEGLVRLELQSVGNEWVVATKGSDSALLPASPEWGTNGWNLRGEDAGKRWYVADDRGLYKPGERAHVKGWVRDIVSGPTGDIELPANVDGRKVTWTLQGARGNELLTGNASVSAAGGFDLTLELPGDANLGTADLLVSLDGSSHRHPILIQEFRRPEVEVTAEASRDRMVLGQRSRIDLDAHYFSGGGLPDAEVRWNAYAEPVSWRPPGHEGYQFGRYDPPWWWGNRSGNGSSQNGPWSFEARTDASGHHVLDLHVEAMNPPRPRTLRVEGTVSDVNRQSWTATETLVVHPASVAVGLKTERAFVEPDEPFDVSLAVVDLDGVVQADRPVELVLQSIRGWGANDDGTELDRCDTTSGPEGLASCTFRIEAGGTYRLLAETRDDEGRRSTSEQRLWVSGEERAPARNVELERILLIPETAEVAPGGTARILISTPFAPAEALITLRRDGLLSTERRTLTGTSTTLEIPITDAHTPDVTVQVDVVGRTARTDDDGVALPEAPKRLAHATGSLTLKVPAVARTLTVKVTPEAEALAPGRHTSLSLVVTDAAGRPVAGAEVVVVVVDEAVLALTNYRMPDPLEVFYSVRGAGVIDQRNRTWVALADPMSAVTIMDISGSTGASPEQEPGEGTRSIRLRRISGDGKLKEQNDRSEGPGELSILAPNVPALRSTFGGNQAQGATPMAVREDFGATALFAPLVHTNQEGRATVPFTLPDSLTRYRIMVVAADAERAFGHGEASLTARLPLMVRPSLPRFLNLGDQAELPVVLQNQTDNDLDVTVAMGVTRLALLDAVSATYGPAAAPQGRTTAGHRVTVPAHDRVEVRFPAAPTGVGTARVQVVAEAGGLRDAARLTLPVYTPATAEAFASTGSLTDAPLVLPVKVPDDVIPGFGGFEVTTSSTQLQALTDAFLYLSTYPYECNEQLASRLLSVASLRDVLEAFDAEGLPDPEALEAQVQADLARLAQRQNPDGGFAFWRRGDEAWPYLSIHVAMAFAEAKKAGYDVDEAAWERSRTHLAQIERHIPGWYSVESRRYLRAFALNVRRRMGDPDPRKARALLAEASLQRHGIEGLSFLLPTLHDAGDSAAVQRIQRHLGNQATETTEGAHFSTSYTDGDHVLLHSSRRADAIALEALLEVSPDDPLLEKLTADLLAHRIRGRWGSTQENAFVLLALRRYFDVREAETPDFVARVWLGDDLVGEHPFTERSTERYHVQASLSDADGQTVTVQRDGDAGRLYYRMALRYAPEDLVLQPADRGFAVERTYASTGDPGDVTQDADRRWHIKAGASVKVTVTMVAEARRYHVALVDSLPAGFEPSNPTLATTGTLPMDADPASSGRGRWWWWNRTWYEHENLRDERAEAFTSLLWAGVHEYSYIAQATTPGRFVVPPARAEEMYRPETFGRSGTDLVIVE